MKRFKLTNKQLNEYLEIKKSEKTFYDIMEDLHRNVKYLNEGVSHKKANQSVIDDYRRRNLITPKVTEMLIKNKITTETGEII